LLRVKEEGALELPPFFFVYALELSPFLGIVFLFFITLPYYSRKSALCQAKYDSFAIMCFDEMCSKSALWRRPPAINANIV
jgi:hypothetical protein